MKTKYSIGTEFIKVGRKNKNSWVVRDILITRDSSDTIVKIRYLCEGTFLGQSMMDDDVVETTIARGLLNPKKE